MMMIQRSFCNRWADIWKQTLKKKHSTDSTNGKARILTAHVWEHTFESTQVRTHIWEQKHIRTRILEHTYKNTRIRAHMTYKNTRIRAHMWEKQKKADIGGHASQSTHTRTHMWQDIHMRAHIRKTTNAHRTVRRAILYGHLETQCRTHFHFV